MICFFKDGKKLKMLQKSSRNCHMYTVPYVIRKLNFNNWNRNFQEVLSTTVLVKVSGVG